MTTAKVVLRPSSDPVWPLPAATAPTARCHATRPVPAAPARNSSSATAGSADLCQLGDHAASAIAARAVGDALGPVRLLIVANDRRSCGRRPGRHSSARALRKEQSYHPRFASRGLRRFSRAPRSGPAGIVGDPLPGLVDGCIVVGPEAMRPSALLDGEPHTPDDVGLRRAGRRKIGVVLSRTAMSLARGRPARSIKTRA